jgi:hypothetical protein
MNRPLIRRVALCLMALLMFSQGAVALAACSMDRGGSVAMAAMADMADMAAEPCMDHEQAPGGAMPHGTLCAAHCTADLQAFAMPVALVRAPADAPVLVVAPFERVAIDLPALQLPPPRGVPPRILLHSFLV